MKAAQPKRKPAAKERDCRLCIDVDPHVMSILTDFRDKHMLPTSNAADAAQSLLLTALMDYGTLVARSAQVERYCKSEGIEDQGEYRESILRAKFPRGRVPRPKAAR